MTDHERDTYVSPGERYAQNGTRIGHGQGLSVRDWFAGKAMAAMISTGDWPVESEQLACRPLLAKVAYAMADEMIAAREK